MRDYELIVGVGGVTEYRGTYSYVFRYCIEASAQTRLTPDLWRKSLDDRLTNYQTYKTLWDRGVELDGFVWSVGGDTWPGWSLVKASERAAWWTQELGIDFHEMLIEMNAIDLRLVFSDLFVTHLSTDLAAADIPGTEESHWWFERYWREPAPSLPFYPAPGPASMSPSLLGVSVDEFRADTVEGSQARTLPTTSFNVLLDERPIGMIQPVGADRSTGVIVGRFKPLPDYEQVGSLFRQITSATILSLPEMDQEAMAPLLSARDALNLSVITAGGRPVPMQELLVYDAAGIDAEPNGYGAEFAVTLEGFFDDPRYWSG